MPKWKQYFIPGLLFILSLALRFALISKGPYHVDCLNLVIQSQKTLDSHHLQYLFGSGYPLMVILGALFQAIGKLFTIQDPVIMVNLISVIFSSLCIPANYLLAKKLLNEITAAFSSILLSISPIFLGISVYGMSHAPSLFFLLTGLNLLHTFFKSRAKRHLVASALLLGLMGATRTQDTILMVVPISFWYFYEFGIFQRDQQNKSVKNRSLKCYCIFLGLAFIITLLFHIPYLLNSKNNHFCQQFSTYFKLGFIESFIIFYPKALLSTIAYLVLSLTPIGFLMAFLGMLLLIKEKPGVVGFLYIWFMVPFYFYGNLQIVIPRFCVMLLPPLLMSAGYCFSRLLKIHSILKSTMLVIFIGMVYASFSFIYPIVLFRHQNELLPDFARWISRNTEMNAQIITSDESVFLEYYGHRSTMKRPTSNFFIEPKDLNDFKTTLTTELRQGTPVYITGTALYSYNWKQFSEFIKDNYELRLIGTKAYEDWHMGDIFQLVFLNKLYSLSLQQP